MYAIGGLDLSLMENVKPWDPFLLNCRFGFTETYVPPTQMISERLDLRHHGRIEIV